MPQTLPARRQADISKTKLYHDMSSEYVKNPLPFVQICGNFSLIQSSIMMGLIFQIQQRINEVLRSHNSQMMLFKPDEMIGDYIEVRFPLKSIGVHPKHYGEIDAALERLHCMQVTFEECGSDGIVYKVRNTLITKSKIPVRETTADGRQVLFKGGKRRRGDVSIFISKECVKSIFTLRQGYTEHLHNIVTLCRRARTPRLYMYLSSWRNKGLCVVPLSDLREFLGLLSFNRDGTVVQKSLYPEYNEFRRFVLDPIAFEIQQLAKDNKIDFYFTYAPIYRDERQRGNPSYIQFRLHSTQRGEEFDRFRLIEQLHAKLIELFELQPEEWESITPMLDDNGIERMNKAIIKLSRHQDKNDQIISHSYVTAYLLKALGSTPASVEVKPLEPSPCNQLSNDDITLWREFSEKLAVALEDVDPQFCYVFLTPCKLLENSPEHLSIEVPTSFVQEIWEKRFNEIRPILNQVFGVKLIYLKIHGY